MTAAPALTLLCLAATAGLVFAEWRGRPRQRAILKTTASLAFVLVALVLGAPQTPYGRWVLGALALGFVGDVLLLSARSAAFLGGLGAFLASHLCFAVAFTTGAFATGAFAVALLPGIAVGVLVVRWLWPHLGAPYRGPVLAYVTAILAMCCCAAGAAAASGHALLLAGAVLFAASDLAVARDRFVVERFVNRAWGLPAYFAAQLMLAWSVALAR